MRLSLTIAEVNIQDTGRVEGRGAVFKKLLLPLVKLGRGDAVLIAHLRQGPLVNKMFPNDFNLFCWLKPSALLAHTKSLSKMSTKE